MRTQIIHWVIMNEYEKKLATTPHFVLMNIYSQCGVMHRLGCKHAETGGQCKKRAIASTKLALAGASLRLVSLPKNHVQES